MVDVFISSLRRTYDPQLREFDKRGISGYYLIRQNFSIHKVPVLRRPLFFLEKYPKLEKLGVILYYIELDLALLLYAAVRMRSKGKPDAIIVRSLPTAFFFMLFKPIFRVPIIYEAHHIINFRHDMSLYAKVREIIVLKHADGVIAVTENIKKLMIKLGIPARKILVRSTGANLEMFKIPTSQQTIRKQLRIPSNRPIVLYIGSLYPYKGANLVLMAFKRVHEKVPNAKLLVVGGLKKEKDVLYIRKLIDDLKLDASVILTGYVPYYKVPHYIKSADVTVFAPPRNFYTEYCGESIKIWQYMAAKKPIVASKLKSLEEALAHEVNALLVTPGDVDGFGDAIVRLINDQALAKALAESAFNDFKLNRTWEKRAEGIIEFTRKIREK